MKFHLESDRIAIQDAFTGVLRDVCTPERRRASVNSAKTDPDLWSALMDVGLGGLWAAEDCGGAGLGALEMALAMESIGRYAAPGPYLAHVLAVRGISESDDAGLKEAWLPALVSGTKKAALIFGQGWTPDAWDAVVGEGSVSGVFEFAHGAGEAHLLVVGVQGGGLVLVETDAPGVSVTPLDPSDRTRSLARVVLEATPARAVCGLSAAQRTLDSALVMLAADALGGAQRCLELSVEYAKTREQFGTVIGQFQALKHQLANMALEVEPARALVWYAAHALDAALPDASRAAAHAKAHLADRFVSVARAAVQAHGGIGYTWDYDLQIWFRRSLFDRAFLGPPSLHRERAASMAGW